MGCMLHENNHMLFKSHCLASHVSEVTFDLAEKISEGEKYYEELTKSTFTYGDCWKKAVSDLQVGCKDLTQEVQSRLALSFANCFLEYSGSDVCPCSSDTPVPSCLKKSSERIFSTYREFFTHTQSICYFLQHKVWQEQTAKTVQRLTLSSEAVGKKLEESSKFQSQILSLQQHAVQEQQKLISNGRNLNIELDKSRAHAQLVFEEFKASTNEQKLMIFEVFDRIRKLQTLVLGEFTGVYSFVFYLAASAFVYILTSTPYTSGARIWLFLVMTINAVLERIISIYSLDEETEKNFPLEADGPIYCKIWLCRKISCGISFLILLFFFQRYKDYNIINNKLLQELQQQNMEIQSFIKNMRQNRQEFAIDVVQENNESQTYKNKKVIDLEEKEKNKVHLLTNESENTPLRNNVLDEKNDEKKLVTSKPRKRKPNLFESPKDDTMMELVLSPGRYNLRSRTNSPAQSSFTIKTPEMLSAEIRNSLKLSSKNKKAIKNISKKDQSVIKDT